MDTADGIFMTNPYHWAFSTPLRKVYYNLTVTALSVTAALLIGMIELAQVISEKLGFSRGIWRWIQNLDIPWTISSKKAEEKSFTNKEKHFLLLICADLLYISK